MKNNEPSTADRPEELLTPTEKNVDREKNEADKPDSTESDHDDDRLKDNRKQQAQNDTIGIP